MFNEWCTIESDPGVFTQLISKVGVKGVQVQQIYSFEDDHLINNIRPEIYGFIFLFKWTRNLQKRQSLQVYDNDLFFARQIVNNACATQAILSVILNAPVTVEGTLKEFHEFTKQLTSEDRGLALSNSESIRIIHNSFSRPEPFIFKEDKKKRKKESDVYHFVSYVPYKGTLYELDGLQPGPIVLGTYSSKEEWIELAKSEIQNRIYKYSEKEIRFNLLVVCQDLKEKTLREFIQLDAQKSAIHQKLKSLNQPYEEKQIEQYPTAPISQQSDPSKLNDRLAQIQVRQASQHQYIAEQQELARERHQQNVRRKHNYVPLIIQMLKTLAKKNKLNGLIEKAVKKTD